MNGNLQSFQVSVEETRTQSISTGAEVEELTEDLHKMSTEIDNLQETAQKTYEQTLHITAISGLSMHLTPPEEEVQSIIVDDRVDHVQPPAFTENKATMGEAMTQASEFTDSYQSSGVPSQGFLSLVPEEEGKLASKEETPKVVVSKPAEDEDLALTPKDLRKGEALAKNLAALNTTDLLDTCLKEMGEEAQEEETGGCLIAYFY